jgi:hypothetical protein
MHSWILPRRVPLSIAIGSEGIVAVAIPRCKLTKRRAQPGMMNAFPVRLFVGVPDAVG